MNGFSNVMSRGDFSKKPNELSVGNKLEIISYFGEKNWSDFSVEFVSSERELSVFFMLLLLLSSVFFSYETC